MKEICILSFFLLIWFAGCSTKKTDGLKGVIGSVWPSVPTVDAKAICTMDTGLTKYNFRTDSSSRISFSDQSQAEAFGFQILRLSFANGNIKFEVDNTGKVKNAEASIISDARYVVYNNNFMNFAEAQTSDQWAAVSILAHEVGHHILGHKKSTKPNELEADEQSGWYMFGLGTTEKQATSAIDKFVSIEGDATHPGRSERRAAVLRGYNKAKELFASGVIEMKNACEVCSDSANYTNSDACRECAKQQGKICQKLIQLGDKNQIAASDTCDRVDLYNVLASSIDKMNSFKAINSFLKANEQKMKIDTVKRKLKFSSVVNVNTSDKCLVERDGKKWDQCRANQYEDLAYRSLLYGNLIEAKDYFAISYTSYPWLGSVDEVYNKVLTAATIAEYNESEVEGKSKIVNRVYGQIANNNTYLGGVPLKYRLKILAYKDKKISIR